MKNQYRIGELAEKAGVTRRTIHYYLSKGLIPNPEGAGLATVYSDEHLYRIILIKKLQGEFLPLNEIKKRISKMNFKEIYNYVEKSDNNIEKSELDNEVNLNDLNNSNLGAAYSRILVGLGVEIHYPVGYEKVQEFADKIYQYAENIMKEG
jgi:DNA-binding transcriptional MerR regulator